MRGAVLQQRFGYGRDHVGIGKHADLDRADVEVIEARIDLSAQELDRRHEHGGDTAGVLCRECRDRAQAEHAVGSEGF